MFKNHKITKSILAVVALMLVATVAFAACAGNTFKPVVTLPADATAENNGGIAVKYGNYLYYVNGLQDDVSAKNTYENDDPRIGSVVRIEYSEIETLLAVHDDTTISTTTAKNNKITELVREKAQTVVPNIVYSGNTNAATASYNGIYIFNNRLYLTTPNAELAANGDSQTNQLVLASYKLDGSDMQKHHTFTSSNVQMMFGIVDGKLIATFVTDVTVDGTTTTNVCNLDVAAGTITTVAEKITSSSITVDGSTNEWYYLNKDGAIAKVAAGATAETVVVANPIPEGEESSTITYTIKGANNGYVYYTIADSNNSSVSDVVLYGKKGDVAATEVYVGTLPTENAIWNDSVVYVKTHSKEVEVTLYSIIVKAADGTETTLVPAIQNDSAIDIVKVVGNTLFYKVSSVTYTLDLATAGSTPVAYAYSLSESLSGWALSEVVGNYVISLSTGSVSLVKFDATTKTNSSSVALTLTVAESESDK